MAETRVGRRGVLGMKWVSRNTRVAATSIPIRTPRSPSAHTPLNRVAAVPPGLSAERLGHDFCNVLRQSFGIPNPFQLGPSPRLARHVEALPAIEAPRHARRDLWVQRIQRDHLVGEEGVARAVG